jgi:hypothetical protein
MNGRTGCAALLAAAVSISACSSDVDDHQAMGKEEAALTGQQTRADRSVEAAAAAISAAFSGTVTDRRGTALAGVTVTINGVSRDTDLAGKYFISVTANASGYTLSLSKKGYAPTSEFHAAGAIGLRHVLEPAFSTPIDPTKDTTVLAPSGVTVALKANSLRTATGAAPAGMVQVTVATYGPLQMPGDFTGVNAAGQQVALESVGAVFIGAEDSAGQALDLRAGMTSDAFIPVPAQVKSMPSCVLDGSCRLAMWQFDPNTGLWVERSAGMQVGSAGTRFTMRGTASTSARAIPMAIPISAGGLGMWNADIEKREPACTIIELVNVPNECFGAGGVRFDLQLPNSAGTLVPRSNSMSPDSPYIVLYNIRANVVQEVKMTLPADAPATCRDRLQISSSPGPVYGFPVVTSTSGVTRFNAGAPWGGTGFPRDAGGALIDFADVALGTHPCHSHVWFQM